MVGKEVRVIGALSGKGKDLDVKAAIRLPRRLTAVAAQLRPQ